MIKKTLRLTFASLGLASAQSWSDYAGVCKSALVPKEKDFKGVELDYYPNKDTSSIDDQSLQEMVFEFEGEVKDPETGITTMTGAAQCFYFTTQAIPGKVTEQSKRYCVSKDAEDKGNKEGKYNKAKTGYESSERIPLWNVKRIETNVVIEGQVVVDMFFHMRYNNFTDPKGYFQYTQALADGAPTTNEDGASEKEIKDWIVEQSQQPKQLIKGVWSDLKVTDTDWSTFTNADGSYMQQFFNVSMIKFKDTIGVKLANADSEVVPVSGCAVDILSGNTIKGAKFFLDFEVDTNIINNFALRLQPIEEYYDTIHSYSQNGDIYSVGYDSDFYDGKIEYTANGYPPQSVSWKLSRALSTSVVMSALTIAGALVGSWAF